MSSRCVAYVTPSFDANNTMFAALSVNTKELTASPLSLECGMSAPLFDLTCSNISDQHR